MSSRPEDRDSDLYLYDEDRNEDKKAQTKSSEKVEPITEIETTAGDEQQTYAEKRHIAPVEAETIKEDIVTPKEKRLPPPSQKKGEKDVENNNSTPSPNPEHKIISQYPIVNGKRD